MTRIGIGTKFHWTHADGNPEWEVTEKRGRGTWIATVVPDDEWAGTTKAFSTEEIAVSLGQAQYWKESADKSEQFFAGLLPGSLVHYNNSFNQYVRCQVVNPDHQLLPIALVGEWKSYDLPSRLINGDIHLGYHAQQIKERKLFRPHASNVYEYQHRPDAKDPRAMACIALDVPPMTEEQKVTAAKHKKLERLQDILRQKASPEEIFQLLRVTLDS